MCLHVHVCLHELMHVETGSPYFVFADLETHYVDQTGFELTEILLPLPLKCWD